MRIKDNKYFKYYVQILLLFLMHTTFAQTIVSGRIVDEHDKPIPFVHVSVENTNLGTISNEMGLFKLILNEDKEKNSITMSALGYQTKKVVTL